ncbi:MAG TPA: cytochrome c3 family protein [Longimicrobiales bacterium]|nr:cytochrome c3 family protein [Longimicrobiales bacterium]
MRKANQRVRTGLAALLAVFAGASCVDEKVVERIVEVERDLFETPAEAAAGMLGYSDQETKLTVCGNCHVGPQIKWEETNHADAWATLQASGHAAEFCEGCHTVAELGNQLTNPAGWTATGEERYHDVQCESCHGPGLDHVTAPADANVPLAPISTGLDNTSGCGECHQGTHHPFVEQWEQSGHGQLNAYPAGRSGCNGCHEAGGILAKWGENAPFLEEGELQPITCAVCHDPHGSDHSAQLRFAVRNVAIEENLCAQCHSRRTVPDPGSSHGLHPHAPEADLFAGEAGFFFPGMSIDRGDIIATHGSEGNPGLCATCHVAKTTVTDAATGEFVFQAVGHGFNAIPCVDAEGIPNSEDCDLTTAARDFQSCATAGCHGSENAAFGALTTAATRFQALTEELADLLAQVDPNGESVGGAIDGTDGVLTTAEGAFFNLNLAEFGGSSRPNALLAFTGAAAHNPFLMEQLLIASIQAVENEYGVAASRTVNLNRTMNPR